MTDNGSGSLIAINSRDDLEAFLQGYSKETSLIIAMRAASTVFPCVIDVRDQYVRSRMMLLAFRALLILQYGRSIGAALRAAAAIDDAFLTYNSIPQTVTHALEAIAYAADATGENAQHAFHIAADAVDAAAYAGPIDVWSQVTIDCNTVIAGGYDALRRQPIPTHKSTFFGLLRDNFDIILESKPESWSLLKVWYDEAIKGATIDPFPIKALREIADQKPEFWGDGDDNPRTPDMVMDDIAARLGWSLDNRSSEDSLEAEKEALEQRPAPHTYTYNSGKIDTNTVINAHDAVGEAIYDDVKEKARKAKAAAGANTGEARLDATLDRFLEMLGDNLSEVNPGKALMSARTIQADISAFETQGASDKLLAEALSTLRDLNGSLDDFLGIFPEIQSINANALALKIQDSDVEAIRGLDAEIEAIAQQSDIVSDTAKAALKDGGSDIDSALDALRTAMSESAAAKALETAAKTMSVKLLSTRNFIAASVRTGMKLSGKGAKALGKGLGEYAKDAGGRAREGSLDAIGASAKGLTTAAIAGLVGMLTTPVVGMAVYVASFRALGKKAEKVAKDNEDAPDEEK